MKTKKQHARTRVLDVAFACVCVCLPFWGDFDCMLLLLITVLLSLLTLFIFKARNKAKKARDQYLEPIQKEISKQGTKVRVHTATGYQKSTWNLD